MKAVHAPLVRHIAIAVVVKLIVLVALWWTFIRDERVDVDAARTAAHLGIPADAHPLPPAPSGERP